MNLVNLVSKSKMAGLFHSHKMIYYQEINKYKIRFGLHILYYVIRAPFVHCSVICILEKKVLLFSVPDG